MHLTLKVHGIDYTDYIESVRIENHAESIIQSHMPSASMVVTLSTEVDESIVPPNSVTFGIGYKAVFMPLVKITRGKGMTELRCAPSEIDLFSGFVPGAFYLNTDWRGLFSTFNLLVEDSLVRAGQQSYVSTPEEILLSLTATAYKQSMIDNIFPLPWTTTNDILFTLKDAFVKQLQTLSEFDTTPATNVTKIEIDYDDIVEEQEVTSRVDPTAVITSKLGDKKKGLTFDFTSSTTWSDAFNDIRLYECSDGSAYAVGIVTGSGASAKTELHMSDGTVKTVSGIVGGITSEWYYRAYTVSGASNYVMEINKLSDDSVLAVQVSAIMVEGGSNLVTDIFSTYNKTVRIRQTLTNSRLPGDLILFGKPVTLSSSTVLLGVAYYKDASGSPTMALISSSASDYQALKGSWLLGAYDNGSAIVTRYGTKSNIYSVSIYYNGGMSGFLSYASQDTAVYPTSVSTKSTMYVTGYKPGYTPAYRNGQPQSSPLKAPPIQWKSLSSDSAQLGWFFGYDQVIVKNSSNHFAWRDRNKVSEFAFSDVDMIRANVKAIVAPTVSLLLFGAGSQNEVRTISLEASPLPENTYQLTEVSTFTGNDGEQSQLRLPFVLQGANQAWPLVPTDKTRLSVQVAALTFSNKRVHMITMQKDKESWAEDNNISAYPLPSHEYYLSVEIDAPQGIFAEKASFAFFNEAETGYTSPLVLNLNNISYANWDKFSTIATVPSDYSLTYPKAIGCYSVSASANWSFRKPIVVDLTAIYGAGNEPTKEWCDENITVDMNNIVYNYSLDDEGWSFYNASFATASVATDKYTITDDDMILPPIGSPVLYHRYPPKYKISCNTTGGWEKLYTEVVLDSNVFAILGKQYLLRFKYKVNSDYEPLAGAAHQGVTVQFLNTPSGPTADSDVASEVASFVLPTTATEDYEEAELIFTMGDTASTYLVINYGFAADSQTVDIAFSEFSITEIGSSKNLLGDDTDLTIWNYSLEDTFTVTGIDLGEEGICLGFDYDFDGSVQLWIDILLLGQPKPWGNSVITI